MQLRVLHLFTLFAGGAAWLLGQSGSGWKTDPLHRQLKYRVQCSRGSATVDWRNGYAHEVSIKANLRSAIYNGGQQVRIAPRGSAQSRLETMDCAPLRVAITQVSVAGASGPAARQQPKPVKSSSAQAPSGKGKSRRAKSRRKRPRVVTARKSPKSVEAEVTPEALASTKVGMTTEQVLAKLGVPAARLTIPEENQLIQIFSYRTAPDKVGAVYLSNGKVSEIRSPR